MHFGQNLLPFATLILSSSSTFLFFCIAIILFSEWCSVFKLINIKLTLWLNAVHSVFHSSIKLYFCVDTVQLLLLSSIIIQFHLSNMLNIETWALCQSVGSDQSKNKKKKCFRWQQGANSNRDTQHFAKTSLAATNTLTILLIGALWRTRGLHARFWCPLWSPASHLRHVRSPKYFKLLPMNWLMSCLCSWTNTS